MPETAHSFGGDARQRLSSLLNHDRMLELAKTQSGSGAQPVQQEHVDSAAAVAQRPIADVVVTYNEVCLRHGTGILLRNLLRHSPSLASIRTNNTYGGEQDIGLFRYSLAGNEPERSEVFRQVLDWTKTWVPRNVLCVPYSATELLVAMALKEMYGARFCLYIMDDQNVAGDHIPDAVMQEAVRKADLRLVISTEMMIAYQEKWNERFYVFPPLVQESLVAANRVLADGPAQRAVLIGNIWSDEWLSRLVSTIRGSGVSVDWFTNNLNAPWLRMKIEDLKQDGIQVYGPLPESEIAGLLPQYGFAIMPTGTLEPEDNRKSIAALSLPSRVPFIVASSHLPVVVIGSAETAVAHFVKREGLGAVASYDKASFMSAVRTVTNEPERTAIQERATALGPKFSDAGALDWLWDSTRLGYPADDRFAFLQQVPHGRVLHYFEEPVKHEIWRGFHVDYRCIRRLLHAGIRPDFVVDIGASTGVWSHSISFLLPEAQFYLVEPLVKSYPPESLRFHIDSHSNFRLIEAAMADKPGKARFTVSADLYNSSLIQVTGYAEVASSMDVKITTLDRLDEEFNFQGRGLLKIDVQFGEHLVYRGGAKTIAEKVDAILVELTLSRPNPESVTLGEWVQLMDGIGFEYFDDGGEWRDPSTGRLLQKDLLFVRRSALAAGGQA